MLNSSQQLQTSNITPLWTDARAQSFSWLTTPPAATFTNSGPVAGHGRKQAVTKTDEGGSKGGRASVCWSRMDVSIHQTAPFPDQRSLLRRTRRLSVLSPFICDAGGELMALAPIFLMDLFVSESASSAAFRWGPETNILTYQTFLLCSRKMRKTLQSLKKKQKQRTPPQFQRHEK